MKRKTKRVLILLLALPGLLMLLGGLFELSRTPDVLQYCALPSAKPLDASACAKKREQMLEALTDSVGDVCFSAVQASQHLTVLDRSADATAVAIGEGFFEVYPRFLTWGRRINETELRDGGRVVMLDEKLAFQLFGDPLPENMRLKLYDQSYRVVGTVRHAGSLLGGEGVGDQQPCDIYLPLVTGQKDGFQPTMEMVSASPLSHTGVEPQFLSAVRSAWRSDGQVINLYKESMRATILPRAVFLFYGAYLISLMFQGANRLFRRLRGRFSEAMTHKYFRSLWPRYVGLVLLHILVYAALVALIALLVVFSAQPIYIFTEWVPENIVSWSSITKVLRNLIREAAGLVRVGSRELRIISFWGGMLRWGTILLLTASATAKTRFGEPDKKAINERRNT